MSAQAQAHGYIGSLKNHKTRVELNSSISISDSSNSLVHGSIWDVFICADGGRADT